MECNGFNQQYKKQEIDCGMHVCVRVCVYGESKRARVCFVFVSTCLGVTV